MLQRLYGHVYGSGILHVKEKIKEENKLDQRTLVCYGTKFYW
jgi:hypothetical protein